MSPDRIVSYGTRNLSAYRVVFVGEFTIQNPRMAFFKNNGDLTISAFDSKNTETFFNVGTVWGVLHGEIHPVRLIN